MAARRSRRLPPITLNDSRASQRTLRCDPIQVSQWKRQLLDAANELVTRGKKSKDQNEGQAKEVKLCQQIDRLQMELEWLKKKSQRL